MNTSARMHDLAASKRRLAELFCCDQWGTALTEYRCLGCRKMLPGGSASYGYWPAHKSLSDCPTGYCLTCGKRAEAADKRERDRLLREAAALEGVQNAPTG